jgi:hypothetical protein
MIGTIYKITIDVVDGNSRAVPVSVEIGYFTVAGGTAGNISVKRLGFNDSSVLPANVSPGERWEVTQAFANTPVFTDTLQAKADAAASAVLAAGPYWGYYN